jgi:hypothetical protein
MIVVVVIIIRMQSMTRGGHALQACLNVAENFVELRLRNERSHARRLASEGVPEP